MHALPLYVLLLFIDLFIYCFFFLLSIQQPRLLFFFKKVLSPSSCFFTSSEKTLSLKICVDSFWNFRFWTLHIHLHQFNIFPFRMSTSPLCSLLLFILYPLVLPVSPCILVSFTFFAIFIFLFFFSWSWIVSLAFFFCFLLVPKNTILFVSFLVGHVLHLFFLLCIVFLCLEKWFLVFGLTLLFCFLYLLFNIQFHIYYFPVLMYLKNVVFFQRIGEDIFCFFLSAIFFFSFSVLLFFFFLKKCVWQIFLFLNSFWNSLLILFSLFTFVSRKNQPRNLHFLFLFSPFSVSLFFQHFSLFSIITFSFIIFSFHPFVHPFLLFSLLLFSPFSILSLFLYLSVSLTFVSIAVVAYPLFVLTHFSSVSLLWSWSLCFLTSSRVFFFISVSVFFHPKKISKFSVVNFLKMKLCLYFLNPPVICIMSRVFFLLASSFFLVCSMFLFLRFFIVTFHDHRYFSWFSFINLFLGLLKRKTLCFLDKRSKISFFFLFSFWNNPCYSFSWKSVFAFNLFFFMRDLENILPFSVFSISFWWNYFVSLCFCPKIK